MELKASGEQVIEYTQQLKNKLKLSDDQYQKVLAVNTEYITRNDALRAGGGDLSKRERRHQSAIHCRAQISCTGLPVELVPL